MPSQLDKDVPQEFTLNIEEKGSVDHNKEEEITNSHTHDDAGRPDASQNTGRSYKKFPKEKRDQIIILCEFIVFAIGVGCCVASFTVPSLRRASLRGILMWQWSLLLTALLGGHLLSQGILKFFILFIDIKFSIRENALYYILGLMENAWAVLWFGMILLAWTWVVEEPSYLGFPPEDKEKIKRIFAKTEHYVTTTLVTILLGSVLWLIKDSIMMKVKSDFHVRRFFDRIRETLLHQYVIQTLSSQAESLDAAPTKNWKTKFGFRYGGRNTTTPDFRIKKQGCKKRWAIVDLSCLYNVDHEDVSCYAMKILIDEVKENEFLKYKIPGKSRGTQINGEEEAKIPGKSGEIEINGEEEAKKAAHLLFGPLKQKFGKEDLERYKIEKEAHAPDEFPFTNWMIKAYKKREVLVRALEGNKKIFTALNRFVNLALIFVIIILWFVFLKVEFRKFMVLLGSAIVGSAFLIGDYSKKLLHSFSFVFVEHPFDVGDYCRIDDALVKIEDIKLLTTYASTLDNQMRHYPNSFLIDKPITNYTQCQHMSDFVVFYLNGNSPSHKIQQLKEKIDSFIKEPEHSIFYECNVEEDLHTEFVDENKIKVTLEFCHTIEHHECRLRKKRKTLLTLHIKSILDDLATPDTKDSKTD